MGPWKLLEKARDTRANEPFFVSTGFESFEESLLIAFQRQSQVCCYEAIDVSISWVEPNILDTITKGDGNTR